MLNQMKNRYLCFICFVGLLCLLRGEVFSQTDPLKKTATLQMQKESLENALSSITKQTGVRFSYNSRLIDPKTKVSIHVQNKTIKEILTIILPDSVSCRKAGVYIVFYKVKENKEQKNIEKITVADNGKHADSCLSNMNAENYFDSTDTMNVVAVEDMPSPALPKEGCLSGNGDTAVATSSQVFSSPLEAVEHVGDDTLFHKNKFVQVSFVYPIGTEGSQTAENTYNISINVLGGVTGETKGVEIGGVYNINRHSSNVQIAGVFNYTPNGKSTQFTNIFNIGDTAHVQAAGIWNFANKSKCQIAGVVNITKKGKFQIGLVNIRDTADGFSFGLVNIVKQGGIMEAGIETDEFVHTAVTFRTGVRRLYTKVSIGYNYLDHFWSVGSGVGTSIRLARNLNLNFELTYSSLNNDVLGYYALTQISPVLSYRFARHFKFYIGPSLNLYVQNDYFRHSESHRFMNVPNNFLNQSFNYIWAGIVAKM
jgi:hypothetical protein